MKAYHEIESSSLETALKKGLFRTSRGDKGDDQAIIKTDRFLDQHCPPQLKQQGINRDDNLYAYIYTDGMVVDITDGRKVPINEFVTSSKQPILQLDIDPQKCFVSDLDAYDTLKRAIESAKNQSILDCLATDYWSKLTCLQDFDPSTIHRPEIMITYDISPDKIDRALP